MAQPTNVNPYWLGQFSYTAPTSALASTITVSPPGVNVSVIPTFIPAGIVGSNGVNNGAYVSTIGTYASDIGRSAISSGITYNIFTLSNAAIGKYWYTLTLEVAPTNSTGSNWTTSDFVFTSANVGATFGAFQSPNYGSNIFRPFYQGQPTNVLGSGGQGLLDMTVSGMVNVTSSGTNIYLTAGAYCYSNGGSNGLPLGTPALKYMTIINPTIQKVG